MRVRFDQFVLDSDRKVLTRGGAPVHLTPRAFRLLALLVAERPRAVGKRELLDTIWSGNIVEESSLKSLVLEIRTALEQRGGSPDVIRTVYGHGYAFDADTVEEPAGGSPEARIRVEVQTRTILLPEGTHEIGRLPSCAVFIDAPSVSRVHARLHVSRDTLLIEDAGSKNGTFILNIPGRPDGTIDSKERAVLDQFTAWMQINGEAIYATRPWKIYGEGPNLVKPGSFQGHSIAQLGPKDIRFTRNKANTVMYAIVLGWPQEPILIQALGTSAATNPAKIEHVQLLGSDQKLDWSQEAAAFRVTLPKDYHPQADYAASLKLTLAV